MKKVAPKKPQVQPPVRKLVNSSSQIIPVQLALAPPPLSRRSLKPPKSKLVPVAAAAPAEPMIERLKTQDESPKETPLKLVSFVSQCESIRTSPQKRPNGSVRGADITQWSQMNAKITEILSSAATAKGYTSSPEADYKPQIPPASVKQVKMLVKWAHPKYFNEKPKIKIHKRASGVLLHKNSFNAPNAGF